MMKRLFFIPVIVVALCLSAASQAASVFRVDDSGSQPAEPNVQLKWKTLIPRGAGANDVETTVRVNIKLNVKPWQGQRGRIYMALPPLPQIPIGALNVEWTTQGRLQTGRLTAGGRGLVYQGPMTTQVLEDVMNVKITGDGRQLSSAQRLQFYFEIEPE